MMVSPTLLTDFGTINKWLVFWQFVLNLAFEDGVLNAETCRSDMSNIHEHCVHLVGAVNLL
jgi:hypothetical protein